MFVEVNDYSLEYLPKGGLDSEGWKSLYMKDLLASMLKRSRQIKLFTNLHG